MSVVIDKLEVPQNCFYCQLMAKTEDGKYMKCPLVGFKYSMTDMYEYVSNLESPHLECPMKDVPKHGRLIDADDFDQRVRLAGGMCEEELTEDFKDGIQTTLTMLKNQPTVIPASEEDSGCSR